MNKQTLKISKLPDGFLSHPKANNQYAKVGQRLGREESIIPHNIVYEIIQVLDKEEHSQHDRFYHKKQMEELFGKMECQMIKVKKIRGQPKSGFELDVKEPQPICEFFII